MGFFFIAHLRGVSKFTKYFLDALFSSPLRGRKTQEIISNLLTLKCRNRHKETKRNFQKCNDYFVTTPKQREFFLCRWLMT